MAFCFGTKASAVAKPPTAPAAAAAPIGGAAKASPGSKRKGAPQAAGQEAAAAAKKAKGATSVADFDQRLHLELGVSAVEYAKAKKVWSAFRKKTFPFLHGNM